jgi:hypothetical protein
MKTLISIILPLFILGCAVGPDGKPDAVKDAQVIKGLTRAVVVTGLNAIKAPETRIEIATDVLIGARALQSALNKEGTLPQAAVEIFVRDPESAAIIQSAIDILSAYYDPRDVVGEVEKVLGPDNVLRLKGFLEGLIEGCQVVVPIP